MQNEMPEMLKECENVYNFACVCRSILEKQKVIYTSHGELMQSGFDCMRCAQMRKFLDAFTCLVADHILIMQDEPEFYKILDKMLRIYLVKCTYHFYNYIKDEFEILKRLVIMCNYADYYYSTNNPICVTKKDIIRTYIPYLDITRLFSHSMVLYAMSDNKKYNKEQQTIKKYSLPIKEMNISTHNAIKNVMSLSLTQKDICEICPKSEQIMQTAITQIAQVMARYMPATAASHIISTHILALEYA
jgi:hypothetical protein